MATEKTKEYLFSNYNRYPITLTHGEGAYVWDEQGNKYLDFLSGIACTPLGHANPEITAAITQQAQRLTHTSNLYYTNPSAELAKSLVAHGGLDKVFFCNSGAEANEAAIKLARKYQWRKNNKEQFTILSATHSFHGRTLATLAATGKPALHEGFTPLPSGFKYLDWNNTAEFCAAIDHTIAAVLLEPIQGEGGIHVASKEFLQAVRAACDKVGALLIFDEIQCGVGRTGHLFAYQYYGVQPDIITLAKGLANGLPIGAVCAKKSIADALQPGDHGSTFGGNPISCSAASIVINTLVAPGYLEHIQQLSDFLLEHLNILQHQYPQHIKEIRGVGLMIGIELTCDAKAVLTHCQAMGLLLNVTTDNVLRLLPPYLITEKDIEHATIVLGEALRQIN